jgi:branched-chain amino acid aminotransferase/4-amino-4-deoxychorismate lyase
MSGAISSDDRGFLLGDGLFETLRVEQGAPVDLGAHLDRLTRGCAVIGLPAPEASRIEAAITSAAAAAGLAESRAAVRVTWSAGSGGRGLERPATPTPRLLVTASPMAPPAGPASLITVSVRRNEGSPLSRLKSLAYLDNVLARREARAAGADEALMLNNAGDVACAAAANLFWIKGGVLFTPALECGVLDGTVRAAVLRRAPSVGLTARQVQAGLAALADVEGLFLTNSLVGLRPVMRLEGREIPISPILADLARACADIIAPSGVISDRAR